MAAGHRLAQAVTGHDGLRDEQFGERRDGLLRAPFLRVAQRAVDGEDGADHRGVDRLARDGGDGRGDGQDDDQRAGELAHEHDPARHPLPAGNGVLTVDAEAPLRLVGGQAGVGPGLLRFQDRGDGFGVRREGHRGPAIRAVR